MRRTLLVRRLFPLLPPQQHPSARGVCSRTSRRSVRRSLVRAHAHAHASARHRHLSVFAQSPAYAQRRVLEMERATGHIGRRIGGPPRAGACVLVTGGVRGLHEPRGRRSGRGTASGSGPSRSALAIAPRPAPTRPPTSPNPTVPTPPPTQTHARMTPSHACSWLSPRARRRGQAAAREHLMRTTRKSTAPTRKSTAPTRKSGAPQVWRPVPNTN